MSRAGHHTELPETVTVQADGKETTYRTEQFFTLLENYYSEFYPQERPEQDMLCEEVLEVMWGNIEMDLMHAKTYTVVDENGTDVETVFRPSDLYRR